MKVGRVWLPHEGSPHVEGLWLSVMYTATGYPYELAAVKLDYATFLMRFVQ